MSVWLPIGSHWDLRINHDHAEDSGPFTGGGRKIIWHTTEGSTAGGAISTLKANRDAAHFVIDEHGNVTQLIPLDRAARALEHAGGPETNRAGCIQIECVGYAAETEKWSDDHMLRLACLVALINHRYSVPLHAPASFAHPHRLGPNDFVRASGHFGHVHVPGNTHTDPGPGFRWGTLVNQYHEAHKRFGK